MGVGPTEQHASQAPSRGAWDEDGGGESLEAIDVSVAFEGVKALEHVDLCVERGEILGLIGANGAGKSTLVNVLTGYQRVDAGSVKLDGREITGLSPEKRARLGLVRTFQGVRLFRAMTVEENIEAAALGIGLRWRAARRRTSEVINLMQLGHLATLPAAVLPAGEERRVALARALAAAPSYLALDEPAAGLNEGETEDLRELVAEIHERERVGVLLIEHDVGFVMALAKRVQVLSEGRTICIGSPAEVQNDAGVIAAYLGTRRATVEA
jgi:branched-chain amino acid transport system ATP-binding protein